MPTDDAYFSGHLVMSHLWTCMNCNVVSYHSLTCIVSRLLSFEYAQYFTLLLYYFPAKGFESSVLCLFLVCCGCYSSYIVSVHIQCQAFIHTLSLCRRHSCWLRLAKHETLTPLRHLASPLVCRVPECPTWCSIAVP